MNYVAHKATKLFHSGCRSTFSLCLSSPSYFLSAGDVKNGWATHTTRPVPVYFKGADSEMIAALEGSSYKRLFDSITIYIDSMNLQVSTDEHRLFFFSLLNISTAFISQQQLKAS